MKHFRSKLLEFLTHKIALPSLSKLRKKPKFAYTMKELLEFPDNTLGRDLAIYLQKMNFRLIPGYERHDCKHIILQYEMNEEGEAKMQFFFLGNRHYSLPVVSTVIICFILMPEFWKSFAEEFRKGRKSKTFDDVDFGEIVKLNTTDLRKQYSTN